MSLTLRHVYKFDSFIVDVDERVLLRDGLMVPLTPKVFETLLLLVKNHGSIVTKEKMLATLWPDVFVEESNVTFNIRMLRKALGDTKQSSVYIETIPRRGYRFKTQVKEVIEEKTSTEIVLPEIASHSSGNGKHEAKPPFDLSEARTLSQTNGSLNQQPSVSVFSRKRIALVLAALALLTGTAAIWRFNRRSSLSAGKSEPKPMVRMPLTPPGPLKIDQLTTYGNVFSAAISPDGK